MEICGLTKNYLSFSPQRSKCNTEACHVDLCKIHENNSTVNMARMGLHCCKALLVYKHW